VTRSIKPNISTSVAPEFMTSPAVADFFSEWLREAIDEYKTKAREAGNSRVLAWEGRTLDRAHSQFSPIAEALNAEPPAES
jgi:hypothetical protein